MNTPQSTERRVIPLRCRLFGHKWERAFKKDADKYGLPIWVYTDDVCMRCYSTEWRMPHARGQ